ncbi:ANR family transcriptional regulator [Enterobacter asburiae]
MATKAAELERSGEYCSAAKAWRHDALFALHQKNEVWAESRAVLCSYRVPVERGSST